MLKLKLTDGKLLTRLALMKTQVDAADRIALTNAGANIVAAIHETLDRQLVEGPALSETTIRLKGHDLKLLETYQMRNSVDWRFADKNAITAGVHDDAPNDRGLIAKIHEHGNDVIPKRAFIGPTWDRVKKDVLKQYDKDLRAQVLLMTTIT